MFTWNDIKDDIIKNLKMRCNRNIVLPVMALITGTLILLVVHKVPINTSHSAVESDSGTFRYKENQIKLYDALHHFALPDVDYDSNVQQRFILQVPGKVLYPVNYHPGAKYEEFLNDLEQDEQKVDIPKRIMERMFYLSDVVPDAHPVAGRQTGYSLARLYKNILDNLKQIGFEDLSKNDQHLHNEALHKLVEPVLDPDDSSKQVPLFQVYDKFQKAYYKELQVVDETNSKMKEELNTTDYHHWFEVNNPILQAQVKAAYRRWLLYGRKHLTESQIEHLDIASSEKLLNEARIALKLSGFVPQRSLVTGTYTRDWSYAVYPVTFSPSNWYKYLSTSQESLLTRDQLEAKFEELNSRIALLETIREKFTFKIEQTDMNDVKQEQTNKHVSLWKEAEELENISKRCWIKSDPSCDIWSEEDDVVHALSETAAANFKIDMLEWHFGQNTSLKGIDYVLEKLNNKSKDLQKQLLDSKSLLISPFASDIGRTEILSLEEVMDKWEYFEFSSAADTKGMVSIGNILQFSPKPSIHQAYHTFSKEVESAHVKIKAKLLKVKISRPWFSPSVFHNREFKLKENTKPISPGYMKEGDLYDEVTKSSTDWPPYLLYQYPTSFLLARDITMDFIGLSDKAKHAALISSSGPSFQGNYGPISFGGSVSASGSYSHMQVLSTPNGVKVYIPGAQIIGYYCDVIPKFPNPYNLTEFSS